MAEKRMVAVGRDGKVFVDEVFFSNPGCTHQTLRTLFAGDPDSGSCVLIDICKDCHVIDPFHSKIITIVSQKSSQG
jgi:hypothetical protein